MAGGYGERLQFYEQISFHDHGLPKSSVGFLSSDPTMVASDLHSTTSPRSCSNISTESTGQLTPSPSKDCALKSNRKRCRASKRTPTTLLSANPTNFRALVQQFTGCPRTSISFGTVKGPITLNFQLGSVQNHCKSATTTSMAPSGNKDNYYNHQQSQMLNKQEVERPRQQQHCEQPQQDQQFMVSSSLDDFIGDHVYSSLSSDSVPDLEMPKWFAMDDISLHELSMESNFSIETSMDDGFFF